jgi:chromosome segregation ATPase
MARLTDTRIRTREIAQQLLQQGYQAHDLTVDSIYAELKQGSRTTINNELKLWKSEQVRAHAIGAQIPPSLAQAVVALWELASEEGRRIFDSQRETLEAEIERLTRECEKQQQTLQMQLSTHEQNLQRLHTQQLEIDTLRQQLGQEQAHKESAFAQQTILKTELNALQAQNQEQQQRFEQEIAKTTERLEAVQKHVLREVTASREAQKQAELLTQQLQTTLNAQQITHTAERDQLRQSVAEAQTQLALYLAQISQINSDKSALLEQLAAARHAAMMVKKDNIRATIKPLRPTRRKLKL